MKYTKFNPSRLAPVEHTHAHAQGHTLMETDYTLERWAAIHSARGACTRASFWAVGNRTANPQVIGRPTLSTEPRSPYMQSLGSWMNQILIVNAWPPMCSLIVEMNISPTVIKEKFEIWFGKQPVTFIKLLRCATVCCTFVVFSFDKRYTYSRKEKKTKKQFIS